MLNPRRKKECICEYCAAAAISLHPAAVRLNFTIETLEETKKSPLRLLERIVKESQFRPNRNIPKAISAGK